MKTIRILPLFILLLCLNTVAQDKNTTAKFTGSSYTNPKIKYDKPIGSPYAQPMFASAKVTDVPQKYYMRYDIYNDVFEFITPKNDTLVLDKIDAFNSITFTANNKNYNLLNYTDTKGKFTNGYLIKVYKKNTVTLYEKENITFYEPKIAKTSMERSMPARFARIDNTYFLEVKNGTIVEFPDSKKRLLKLMPEHKEVLETFLKENKVSFDDPSDRIKIVDFIATL